MKSIYYRSVLFIVSLFVVNMLAACKSTDSSDAPSRRDGPVIECRDNFYRILYEDSRIRERGPVDPEGMECSELRNLGEEEMMALKKNGQWERFYSNSTDLMMRGRFVDDLEEGRWEYFNRDGHLIRHAEMQNGQKNGREVAFFSGSQEWRARGSYQNGEKQGGWEYRLGRDSTCITSGSYSNGAKNGRWEECAADDSGNEYIQFQGDYARGVKDGPAKFFHENGNLMAEGSYVADLGCVEDPPPAGIEGCEKRSGPWKIYFPEGSLATEGSYDAGTGRRIGTWTEYFRSGQRMAMGPRNHTRSGMWTFFDRNGTIIGQYRFRNNDFTPDFGIVYEDGRKVAEGEYAMGMIRYDAENDEMQFRQLKRNGHWIEYFSSGRKSGEGEYVMDLRTGTWTFYDRQSGNVTARGDFLNGRKQGTWMEMENGQRVHREYMMGRLLDNSGRYR